MTFRQRAITVTRLLGLASAVTIVIAYWLYARETVSRPLAVGMVVAPLIVGLAWVSFRLLRHRAYTRRFSREAVTYTILLRSDESGGAQVGGAFWNQASDLIPRNEHIIFGIEAVGGQYVQFTMTAFAKTAKRLINEILADWKGSQVRARTPEYALTEIRDGRENRYTYLRLSPKSPQNPISTSVVDPITPVLSDMSRLRDGVIAGVSIAVRPDGVTWKRLNRQLKKYETAKTDKAKQYKKRLAERIQRPFLEVQVLAYATEPATLWNIGKTFSAQFESTNRIKLTKTRRQTPYHFPLMAGTAWTDAELGLVAHFLGREGIEIAPQLRTATSRSLPPSPRSRVPQGSVLLPKGFSAF